MFSEKPYLSEPYNKNYYLKLLTDNNFLISEKYISNSYLKIPHFKRKNKKIIKRYNKSIDDGYKIISPKKSDWDTTIREIYFMIMEQYKDFPIFKK